MKNSDVFVSYRRKDVAFVKRLSEALGKRQREVWLDWSDIPPGVNNFTREIEAGIESANVFIAVLSPDYLVSEYCLAELQYADRLNKRILPIVCHPLGDSDIPSCIGPINWVYFIPHAGQENTFDTAFEAMLRAMDTDYDHVREHTRLLARSLEWQHKKKNTSLYLSGDELEVAEQWLAAAPGKEPLPVDTQTEFIRDSRIWQTRRQRRLLGGALALLALAVVGLIAAVIAGQKARQQQQIAERRAAETLSMATANAASRSVEEGDYVRGLNLAYFANTSIASPAPQVVGALRRIALQPGVRHSYPSEGTAVLGMSAGDSTRSSDQSATVLHLEPGGDFVLKNREQQEVQRFRPLIGPRFRGAYPVPADFHRDILKAAGRPQFGERAMELAPDGKTVAVGRESGLMLLNNKAPKAAPTHLSGHELPVDGVRFSGDGRRLVTRGSTDSLAADSVIDREFIVWDTIDWEPLLRLDRFAGKRDLLAFSEDGRRLLFLESSPPGYTLWDVDDPRRSLSFRGPRFVMDLAFTPDGESIVIASVSMLRMRPPRDFRVYKLTGEPVSRFGGRVATDVNDLPILFGADGIGLKAIERGGRLFEVDIASGTSTPSGQVPDLTVEGSSNNDRFLVLRDYEGERILVWDLKLQSPAHEIPDTGAGLTFTVSDDGRYLAHDRRNGKTGETELVVRDLLQADTAPVRFAGAGEGSGYVGSIWFTFGPGTREFHYGDARGEVHRVDIATWREVSVLRGLSDKLSDIVPSPDGRFLAAAAQTGRVLVWDLEDDKEIQRIEGTGSVVKLAFSPDGRQLLSGDERGRIAVWRLTEARDLLDWVQKHRALQPVHCTDLLQADLISSADNCPMEELAETHP